MTFLSDIQLQGLENASLTEGLEMIHQLFGEGAVFSSSLGQEDQVITDVIFRNNFNINIFTIDTGRLFNETYELLDRTTSKYKKDIGVFFPIAEEVEQYVSGNGINGFYGSVESRKSCCHVRKVNPLNRALSKAKIWITGLRADQSGNRQQMPVIEWLEDKQLYKFNPLLHWSYEDVVDYLEEFNVPYNHLHKQGFFSIGCAPCTRAIMPGEDPRAGRWWWESSQKECGLHQTKAIHE